MGATSISLGFGRTALFRGMLGPQARTTMIKTKTQHYSSTFHGRQYSSRPCRDLRLVPIVRAKVDEDKRRWVRKAARAGVVSSAVLACVVGMMSLRLSSNGRTLSAVNLALAMPPASGPHEVSEMALAMVPGQGIHAVSEMSTSGLDAKSAITALMQVSVFLVENSRNRRWCSWWHQMPTIDSKIGPDRKQVAEIKVEAMYMLSLGKSEKAEKLLKDQYNNWKSKGGEVKHNLEMALVEILMAQGKFDKAKQYDCIKDKVSSVSLKRSTHSTLQGYYIHSHYGQW